MDSKRVLLRDKYFVPFLTREEIARDVRAVAARLSADLPTMERPFALGVLNGSFVFAADLLRELDAEMPIHFVKYASYAGTESTGEVRQMLGLAVDVRGRDVIVVEDIVDTGLTMRSMIEYLKGMGAKSVRVATMFCKPEVFQGAFRLDYVGREIPNRFVVGYGLDYDEMGRALPDLYVLEEGQD